MLFALLRQRLPPGFSLYRFVSDDSAAARVRRLNVWSKFESFRRFGGNANGNVTLTFALALPVVFGAVAAMVDYTIFATERARLQAAADAAALNAVRELQLANPNPLLVLNVAKNYALAKLGPQSDATIETQLIGLDSIEVRISKDLKPTLSRVFSNDLAHIAARAVAKAYGGFPLCILGLDGAAVGTVQLQNLGRITAVNCTVNSNSNNPAGLISQDLALLTSARTCSAGGTSQTTTANFVPRPLTDCPKIPDPLMSRPTPSVGPCTFMNTIIADGGTTVLSPGTYCGGITVSLASQVQLRPGVYVMKDGPLTVNGGATLQGQYVGFYLLGSASTLSWDTTSHISLTAPKDGVLSGILIYEDPSSPSLRQHTVSSDDARTLLGTIYMPQGQLVIGSNKLIADLSAYTIIVTRMLKVQGSANLVLNTQYGSTDVPVPMGVGPLLGGKIRLTQ
jgi:hypothetical protein